MHSTLWISLSFRRVPRLVRYNNLPPPLCVSGECRDRCSYTRSVYSYYSSYFHGRYYYQCNRGSLYYRSCGLNQSYYPGLGRCG